MLPRWNRNIQRKLICGNQVISNITKSSILISRNMTTLPRSTDSVPNSLTMFQDLHNKSTIQTSASESTISLTQLFTNKSTRGAVFKLLALISVIQAAVFYVSSSSIVDELRESEDHFVQLWNVYEQRDISQAVMAIHIGQLKHQLLKAGIQPLSSKQAMTLAQHLISFERDPSLGTLLIFVDPKSPIYPLVPFSSEYDISKISRFQNAVSASWIEQNENQDGTDEDSETKRSS